MGATPKWAIRTALALVICPLPRHVVAAEDEFFKGKTVTLVVGYSAGGGYDQYARALARHLGGRIPGNPAVLVANMPGAASLTAVR
jgi:tripartite-type tricarboxylate transporter receptor subunit TctC